MSESDNHIMIEADGLTKQYAAYTAVNNLSFSCKKGEIVGFLGPNGAGKTTTMRMLTGYMPPTAGDAYISGFHTIKESMAARETLGYLPENVPLYPEMSVEGYLEFIGNVRRIDNLWDRIDDVLEQVDLLDRAESFLYSLSKGMKQRIGLAQALLHDPDVLILDEPTIGLDPAQIVEIRDIIADVGRQRTVLLSTHILQEVEQICSRVIMVIDGKIQADMSMAEIRSMGNQVNLRLFEPTDETVAVLTAVPGVTQVTNPTPNYYEVSVDGAQKTRLQVAETAVNSGWGLLEMVNQQVSLESIFLKKLEEADRGIAIEESYTEEEE